MSEPIELPEIAMHERESLFDYNWRVASERESSLRESLERERVLMAERDRLREALTESEREVAIALRPYPSAPAEKP